MENIKAMFGDKIHKYCENVLEAIEGVDCLAINTEWNEYRTPDFKQLKSRMKEAVVFDGRNLFDLEIMEQAGFTYFSVGRRSVEPGKR